MNRTLIWPLIFTLIFLMLTPLVASTGVTRGVTVGSFDPSVGYDKIANGTTTFLVPQNKPVHPEEFYHNITQRLLKVTRIEATKETSGSYYDPTAGKYFVNASSLESVQTSVPDPSGRVTAFSNIVFANTGSAEKRESFIHPDAIGQSILTVTGYTADDVYARNLTVTIYNYEYPSGYQVDNTVVAGTFVKSYDVTSIVAGREINQLGIVLTTYVGSWNVNAYFQVSTAAADVYIITIPDVAMWLVSNMDAVRAGVEQACMVNPLVQLTYFQNRGLTYLEINDMYTYQSIIQYPEYMTPQNGAAYAQAGIIVVNAHGEVFPVPPGISWGSWLDEISTAVQTGGLTWVQVVGYPFYYYSSGSYSSTFIGPAGFQRFLQPIIGSNTIDCWPNQEGQAVPLQGGYDNRLWGYGLVNGGLHEGRPLKISSSTNLADLLDVSGYRSGGIEYLTLGLVGFASPNEQIQVPNQRAGYYVHNGAEGSDSDYNKGKYSMAVAAWTKISILDVECRDIYYTDWTGGKWYMGEEKSQVAWSYAVPPSSSSAPWTIRFVTATIAYLVHYSAPGPALLNGAWGLLGVQSFTSSGTSFSFISGQSTTLYDDSQNSWQNTIAQGFLWTGISILLIPYTMGWTFIQQVGLAVALGFGSTVTTLPWGYSSPVTSGPKIDLKMEDLSNLDVQDSSGTEYMQLESLGVTEAYIAQSANGGAWDILGFGVGQQGRYYLANGMGGYYVQEDSGFQFAISVQPYTSVTDTNQPPGIPTTPSGPAIGYTSTTYTYSTSAIDPNGNFVLYKFNWGDGNSITGEYESGNVAFASHYWGSPGTYNVGVQAEDSNGAWSALSSSLAVTISKPKLTISTVGSGSTSSNPSSSDGYYDYGTPVTVTPTAHSNYYFDHWSLDGTTYTTNPITVPMTVDHSLTAYFYHTSDGCPFVSTWNGTCYVLDNNILPQSEMSNGTDVTDYYTLEQPLVPTSGQYALLLSEFEHEHSFIDYAHLVAVDHRANVNIGVSPTGQVLTYTHPYPAVSAISNDGKNVRQLLSQVDGNYYEGYNGSYVTLNFGRLDVSRGAKLVIVSDLIIIKCPIYIQTLDAHGNWRTVATIYTRNFWATDVIDLKSYLPEAGGRLMVRLCFVHNDTVDFVGLDTSPQARIDIHPGQLVSALSSADGDVTANLLYPDKVYAELVPSENIQLAFNLPAQTMQARTYIIETEGHYYTITS